VKPPAKPATIKWPRPWDPAPLDDDDIRAIKALAAGRANETQQRLAVSVIADKLARAGDPSFWPDSERGSAFAAGKRFVAQQLLGAINMDMPSDSRTSR
jgi:hypothetical protein